ncbi:MAG: stage II sporulation protein M [Halanaerobiales bacterium]
MDNLKQTYKKIWTYLKEIENYILITCIIFFLSTVFGFVFPVFFHNYIREFIQEVMEITRDMNFLELLIYILKNNLTVSLMGALLGAIAFGAFPLVITLFNGYAIGYISRFTVMESGFSSLIMLLPHGIFELPAVILSLGMGLKLGMFIFAKNKKKKFSYDLRNILRVFVFVIIPLLTLAATIEAGLIILFS